MKTRNVFAASVVLIGSTLAFSAIAASNYDSSGRGADSAHPDQDQRRVEIKRDSDHEPTAAERVKQMGYDSSEYAKGLMSGGSSNDRSGHDSRSNNGN